MKQADISLSVQYVCGRRLSSSHPLSLSHFPSSLTASGKCEMVLEV